MDTNGDSVIDKEEIREGMRKAGMEEPSEQELMMIMNRCDSDGNGGIDIKEFEDLKSLKLHHLGQALLQEDRLDKVNKEDETPKKRKSRRRSAFLLVASFARRGSLNSTTSVTRAVTPPDKPTVAVTPVVSFSRRSSISSTTSVTPPDKPMEAWTTPVAG